MSGNAAGEMLDRAEDDLMRTRILARKLIHKNRELKTSMDALRSAVVDVVQELAQPQLDPEAARRRWYDVLQGALEGDNE